MSTRKSIMPLMPPTRHKARRAGKTRRAGAGAAVAFAGIIVELEQLAATDSPESDGVCMKVGALESSCRRAIAGLGSVAKVFDIPLEDWLTPDAREVVGRKLVKNAVGSLDWRSR